VGHDCSWHESEVPVLLADVGYRGMTGQHLLAVSFSRFDPNVWSGRAFEADSSTAAALVLVLGCPQRRAGSLQERRSKDQVAISERLCGERNIVSLSNWSLHSLTHRRKIRNLASAFVGEIAARTER
jgi:hypothetical protein